MTRGLGPISVLIPAAALLAALAGGTAARAQTLPLPPKPPVSPGAAGGEPSHFAGPVIDPLAIPLTAPPPPVLPPPIVIPVRPQRPPPPATVTADAPGVASDIPGGIRITFGPGRAELNPRTYAALQALLAAASPASTFTVRAYAAGRKSDPSFARRLSLSRALAVRSVLIHGGIASPRIAVLALGAAPPAAAPPPAASPHGAAAAPVPDRADITETEPK